MRTSRSYELKRRAERQDETHRRIVEATVELHTTVGPARTTVAAIAERAGVTRPTVYAHFPDADALFRACSGHVRENVPLPDLAPWSSIQDPAERLRVALAALYAYHDRLEPLLENVLRDKPLLPILREIDADRIRYLEQLRDLLLVGWPITGKTRTSQRAAIGLALDFRSWQALRAQGCTDDDAIALMLALVRAAAPAD